MTISLPVLSEALPRASGWAMAARLGLPLLFLVGFVAPSPRADDWGGLVTISTTMGVNDGRICTGEGSRGDIGCAANAPFVSSTTGYLGIGTSTPNAALDVLGTISTTSLLISDTAIGDSSGFSRLRQLDTSKGVSLYFGNNVTNANGPFFQLTGANHATPNRVILSSLGYGHLSFVNGTGIGFNSPALLPSSTLHLNGAIRLSAETSTTLQTCDPNRTGAIKYTGGDFSFCRNGSSWETLTAVAGNSTPDRITSGTSYVQANPDNTVSISGSIHIGKNTATNIGVEIGSSATGNRSAHIDLIGDTTYADYGLRIIRTNAGSNTHSQILHRGTGALTLFTLDNAPLVFTASSTEAMRIRSNGNVGIGTAVPATNLDVSGTVSATTLQLANNPANPCNAANKGMAKVVDGRIYVCRYP